MADHKLKGEENVEDFLQHLYTDISTDARYSAELPDMIDATREMVERIVAKAFWPHKKELEHEGVTNIKISDAGSMAEGTKICDPDEFDFVIAFTYSPGVLKTLPPSNERDILFANCTVKPNDRRFCQIGKGKNNELFLSKDFRTLNFLRLESALLKVSEAGPIRRGKNSLCLDIESVRNYGMKGPAFKLHKLVKWCSPEGDKNLFISIDLVPAIAIYDEIFADEFPAFIQGCSCAEHLIHKPDHFLLLPVKSIEILFEELLYTKGDDQHREAKSEFASRNYMVSLSEYERDIMKTWQCEKSIYHNWFVCYKLMKCFGDLDHNFDVLVRIDPNDEGLEGHIPDLTISNQGSHESFASYTWKILVFEMASKETSKLTLKQCFDRLTALFDKGNLDLDKSKVLEVNSFWWPSVISEEIHLDMRDSKRYKPYVDGIIKFKEILNEIIYDPSYKYPHYKGKLKELFPKLASYFHGK
ncbi:uncharacterized protein LOC132727421 [Ruditapes philippinarum]|uniref:uncharacterized protein LOC132727421 n=1 Tax=Ruditapes philippinarum TaxID=129788 RepID=UPI00295AEBCE|nr:uncharacterized protein LOC132727421 [Ruditapes philippinarum]